MQQERRTNEERSQQTRGVLLEAARELFVEKGFGGTSTPDVAKLAGVSRGALYHQFEDKKDLFRAVLLEESSTIVQAITAASSNASDPRRRLEEGAKAYLTAMRRPGSCRLLLVEGPAALGADEMRAIDQEYGAATLVEGLRAMMPSSDRADPAPYAELLSACFERAAMARSPVYDATAIEMLGMVADHLGGNSER